MKRSMFLKFMVLCAIAAAPYFCADAQAAKIYPAAGSTSAAFLKIGVGARAIGMAGAFTAVADDPYAIYWNPAGLSLLSGSQASFTHNDYFQDLKQDFMTYSFGKNLGSESEEWFRRGCWGFGLNYFYTPKDIERRGGLNENDPLNPLTLPEGRFRAYDMAFSAGYGWDASADLKLGAAAKFIRQTIDNDFGQTMALDLGGLYTFSGFGRDFTAGLSVSNIGSGIKFNYRRFDLPLIFRGGISHKFPGLGALTVLDIYKPIDNYPFITAGVEYPAAKWLFIRSGYRYRINDNELGAFSGFSAGAGFVYGRFNFDYAFSPFGDLGSSHRFSVLLKFGRMEEKKPSALRPVNDVVPAREEIKGGVLSSYVVAKKPISISAGRTDFAVSAETASGLIPKILFRTRMRSSGEVAVSMAEGELPPALLEKLPKAVKVYEAFQFSASAGNISGNMNMDFKVNKDWLKTEGAGAIAMLVLTKSGWEAFFAASAGEDDAFYKFTSSVPPSSHYAIIIIK